MLTSIATTSADETLNNTTAFDRAYAASFYQFDACGDWLAGRAYRAALTAKLKQCPFSDEAINRFQLRSVAQRRKSSQAMAKLIEDKGGLPVRLEGMTRTCREQIESPEYQALRAKLDAFAAGKTTPATIVTQSCDADQIIP
jgi:hypothetical protein